MVVPDSAAILRENEKRLRRCCSISSGKKLIPSLIIDAESESSSLRKVGEQNGRPILRLSELCPRVYYLPGFLGADECLVLSREILSGMIDSPPHSNNFGKDGFAQAPMWREFLNSSENPSLRKLRWSCVGYHYNWGERSYDPKQVSKFPDSFSRIYKSVLECVNSKDQSSAPLQGDPQSAIINFYHCHRISDRLGGHRDDVEATDSTPLVSISLGLPGFFLIENEALVLRGGDVLIMADEARQSLHGVPCIIGPDRRDSKISEVGTDDELDAVKKFLSETRISISIRQVY